MTFGCVDFFDKPIRAAVFALHIEAAAKNSTGTQHTENLPVCRLLVRKGVKPVEGQHYIKAAIFKGQRAHIALLEPDTC